jgi:Flp pilus assembly protein TadB
MVTLDTAASRARRVAGVDLAGTEWPLYKLEALAVGVLVLLALLVITASGQVAVLAAAAATTVTWWVRLAYYSRA